MVMALSGAARPVVRPGRHDEPDAHAPPAGIAEPAHHGAVGDVRVDDVEGVAGTVDQLGDGVRDRPHRTGRVVEDHGRDGARRW
jgi:hypothetical protein